MPRIENRQSRPAGSYLTSEVAAPARGNNEATMYRTIFDMTTANLNDPTLIMSMTLEGSIDGTTWRLFAQAEGWQGGTIGRDGNVTPPRLSWMASDNRVLTRVRVRWTQNKTASIGCTLNTELVDTSRGLR